MAKNQKSEEQITQEVVSFLESYTGNNAFITSVKASYQRYSRVTPAQAMAVYMNMNTEEPEEVAVDATKAKKVAEVICVQPGVGRRTPEIVVGSFVFKANQERSAVNIQHATETYVNRYKQERPKYFGTINRSTGELVWGGRVTTDERKAIASMIVNAKVK